MLFLYSATIAALIMSVIADKNKTALSLKTALKIFLKILPDLLLVIVLAAFILYFIPASTIGRYLGADNQFFAITLALVFGSITMMPGFIAFPLCGLLLHQGVPYFVLGAFSTSLMMVGVVTFPFEKTYLGVKTALLRNFISLVIALIVSLVIGIIYREILL